MNTIQELIEYIETFQDEKNWSNDIWLIKVSAIKLKESQRESIKSSELILIGYKESFYEWYKCPKCERKGLSSWDNYCPGCGVKILKQ